jgi:hypothetical protein
MSAREDVETFMAWARLAHGYQWTDPPPNPTDLAMEIARLLRLGEPVPPFAQKWLADFLDPPPGYEGELSLVFKYNKRAAQKHKTELKNYRVALDIMAAKQRGLSTREAVAEIMPSGGMRAWRSARRFLHPWLLARLKARSKKLKERSKNR